MKSRAFVYLFAFLSVQGLLLLPPSQHLKEEIQDFETHKINMLQNVYQIAVGSYAKTANLLFQEVIDKPEILRWVAQAERGDAAQQDEARTQLYERLKKTYDALTEMNLRQLHFQLPDGTSFLRFHRPDKFGDKLFEVRYSLKQANALKIPVYGFEEGRIYNGFRYVFPLFYEGRHVGSVETSVSFPAIEEGMKTVIPHEFMMLLKKKMVQATVFSAEQKNYLPVSLSEDYVEETAQANQHRQLPATLLNQINSALHQSVRERLAGESSFVANTSVEGVHYIAVFMPLRNFRQQIAGYVVSYEKNATFADLERMFYIEYAGLTIINLLIFAFFLVLIRNKAKVTRQNRKLIALNQDKNELLGIAAHDLKNPLSAIKGYAEEIYEDAESMSLEEIRLYAAKIGGSAERMFSLITNLLDINAIESGKFSTELRQFSIEAMLIECMEQYHTAAARKQITLEWIGVTGCHIHSDPRIFLQVMDNLVSNAIKYSPPNSRVQINAVKVDGKIQCIVADQGPGLSQEDQAKLFGKFVRLTPTPTAGEHSTGLGLFIVKKLVETLNARIWCESRLGEGTRFIVELCCCQVAATKAAALGLNTA